MAEDNLYQNKLSFFLTPIDRVSYLISIVLYSLITGVIIDLVFEIAISDQKTIPFLLLVTIYFISYGQSIIIWKRFSDIHGNEETVKNLIIVDRQEFYTAFSIVVALMIWGAYLLEIQSNYYKYIEPFYLILTVLFLLTTIVAHIYLVFTPSKLKRTINQQKKLLRELEQEKELKEDSKKIEQLEKQIAKLKKK